MAPLLLAADMLTPRAPACFANIGLAVCRLSWCVKPAVGEGSASCPRPSSAGSRLPLYLSR